MAKKDLVLGKEVKTVKNSWTIVNSSIQSLNEKTLKRVSHTEIREGDYGRYLRIYLDNNSKYVDFTLDIICKLQVGDSVDPKSILVYKKTNKDKEITRAFAKKA